MNLSALFVVLLVLSCRAATDRRASRLPQLDRSDRSDPPGSATTPRQIAEMRADILMARKEYSAAAAAYEDILQNEPKNADLLNKTGIAYQQLGRI